MSPACPLCRAGLLAAVLLALQLLAPPALAQRVVHRVRFGETFAGVSRHYYGTPRHASLLRQVNHLPRGRKLQPGSRIDVPTSWWHRVRRTTTVQALANALLGHRGLAPVLAHFNRIRGRRVLAGKEVVVPYLLQHTVGPRDTVTRVAKRYYGTTRLARLIRVQNRIRGNALTAGETISVPMGHVVILRRRMERLMRQRLLGLTAEPNREVREGLQEANALLRRGEYWAVPLRLLRLLGSGEPSEAQLAEAFKLLAVAYVALDQPALARRAFAQVLRRQPDYEPDPITTSPRVIRVFLAAKQARTTPDK